jgi:hypothetical protein
MLSSTKSKRGVLTGLAAAVGLTLLAASPAAAQTQSGNAGGQVLQQQLRQNTTTVVPPASATRTTSMRRTSGRPSVNVTTSVSVPVTVVFNIAQQCQQTTNSCIVKVH